MTRLKQSLAPILVVFLVGAITLCRAQTQATDDSSHANAKRQSRRDGRGLMPIGSNGTYRPELTFAPQAVGANLAVLGGGTVGRLTKWTGFTNSNSFVGNSTIFEDKNGRVGIGTDTPSSKLTVMGLIESTGAGGIKFPDGTIQTTSAANALFSVTHDDTLMGAGTQGSPLGLAIPTALTGSVPHIGPGLLSVKNTGNAGLAIKGVGGDSSNNEFAGPGVFGVGGGSLQTDPTRGGPGVLGAGGRSENGEGGRGVEGNGGDVNPGRPGPGGPGVYGVGGGGIFAGFSTDGGAGVIAIGGNGRGAGKKGGPGIVVHGGGGFEGATVGEAGAFTGDVAISGDLNVVGTKNFKIDHPLDPENKYLYHAAIESSEVLNIYSGNVTTDANGDAAVTLPDWFEAVNRDFRYQLTVVGTFAQAIVSEKIKDNRFTIRTNAPGVEVSWQVTGIRSDAVMLKHPFKVEEEKPESERGYYLSPDAYSQPEERSVDWARNPELMQQLKERRTDEPKVRKHRAADR
jgi:hypothetical protein